MGLADLGGGAAGWGYAESIVPKRRAAFASMAGQYAECAGRVAPGREWTRVVFSGGLAARFPRLRCEVVRRLGGPPVRLAPADDDTLRGLLTLALVSMGRAATVSEASRFVQNGNGPPNSAGRAHES